VKVLARPHFVKQPTADEIPFGLSDDPVRCWVGDIRRAAAWGSGYAMADQVLGLWGDSILLEHGAGSVSTPADRSRSGRKGDAESARPEHRLGRF